MTQLALEIPAACKHRGCVEPVVGHSITGEGHVCKAHNVGELARDYDRKESRS